MCFVGSHLKNTRMCPCVHIAETRVEGCTPDCYWSLLTSGGRKPEARCRAIWGTLPSSLSDPVLFAFYTTNVIPRKNIIKITLDTIWDFS